ncbi:hypothetical protein AGMMS49992_28850 [Clostridia bacterium]|nr:hypothetical protein AGMMS49992_28850 [Clostridia bacterium]
MSRYGKELKALREQHGVSQYKLAEALGVKPIDLERVETGWKRAPKDLRERIKAILDVNHIARMHLDNAEAEDDYQLSTYRFNADCALPGYDGEITIFWRGLNGTTEEMLLITAINCFKVLKWKLQNVFEAIAIPPDASLYTKIPVPESERSAHA